MKTIIISTSSFGKAIPDYFKFFAEYLSRNNYKVIIIFDNHYKYNDHNSSIIYKSWPSKRPTGIKDFLFFLNLLKEYRPNTIIGQFGSANINLIVGRLMNVPNRVIYWHTMFEQIKIDRKRNLLKEFIQHYIKKKLLRYCCTLIMTNSNATKNDLKNKYQIPTKIELFPYLIEDPAKNINIKLKHERELLISFVSRLDKSKGHEIIIKELPSLISLYPNIKLYIIGDGKERMKLEKLIIYLGLETNVKFIGAVKHKIVHKYMANSLIHISASKEEAFGLVNVEALATATPIIANKVGGIKEILLEHKNGLFFNPLKKGSFKYQVQEIINNWETYSYQARKSFEDRYILNDMNISNHFLKLKACLK
jgi:glycosyltransferase involved in cell wall biosynthesis